ncbi:MAG: ATP-binding protein [Chloroflexota bacterium]
MATRLKAMGERILIVDDSRDIRHFLSEYILKPKGFEVITATNGLEGLALAISNPPHLMIVDMQMPRMTGLELLQRLSDRGLVIPAIITTAHGSEAIAVEALRLGVRDYMIKPFEAQQMEQAIERALRESRLEQERNQLTQQLVTNKTQLERRLQELNTLYSVGKSVAASLQLEEVLRRVVEAAVFLTQAEEGFLLLVDKREGELYVRASKNLDAAAQAMRLRVKDSLAGRVLETKRPLVLGSETRWQQIKTAYLVRSLVYIPLLSQGEGIGVLTVTNRTRNAVFSQRDTRLLAALADYAALAIGNANIFGATDRERSKLNTVLSQSDAPILLIEENGRLAMVNEAARLALGLPDQPMVGQLAAQAIANEELLEFIGQPVGPALGRHTEIKLPDGRTFDVDLKVMEGIGRSIVMHDVTHLKELDRLKSEFVSVISHDIRSPLTAILSYVELLANSGPLDETQTSFVESIRHSVRDITGLITNLLDLGRLEAGLDVSFVPCSVVELLTEIQDEVRPLITRKQLHLTFNVAAGLPMVLGDRQRLRQCFANLVGNALKFTPKGGRIGVVAGEQDGQVIVAVSDTGIGIAPADQPYIFDKFFRAADVVDSYEGSGLGLSLVKSIVDRHRGRIWVRSELGKGSTFTVLLPAAADQ